MDRKIGLGFGFAVALGVAAPSLAQQAVQWRVEDGGNGHWYAVLSRSTELFWNEAADIAVGSGAHLASVRSSAEWSFVLGLITGQPGWNGGHGPWLGGYQDRQAADYSEPGGGWRWQSGEPFDFTAWAASQPSNDCSGIAEDFLHVYGSAPGLWNDIASPAPCTSHPVLGAVLEWSTDCNGDGIVDYGQILDGTFEDANSNGVPDVCEAPAGTELVADNQRDFLNIQGQGGWFYEFDQGVGSAVVPMGHFVTSNFPDGTMVWCTRPGFGGNGSYCHLGRESSHTSTPSACSSAGAGLERPRRRWSAERPISGTLSLTGRFFSHDGFTARLQVFVDGNLVLTIDSSPNDTLADPTLIDATVPLVGAGSIVVVTDPLDGSCHTDTVRYIARVFGTDCDANGIADYVEIGNGGTFDLNNNGIPDSCEIDPCPSDVTDNGVVDGVDLSLILALWGTSGQKFPRSDANGDGTVDANDLAIVLSGWGNCPD